MNKFYFWGLDYYYVAGNRYEILSICKVNKIEIFDIRFVDEGVYFYSQIFLRYRIHNCLKECTYLYTTGFLGYLFTYMKNIYRMVAVIICICLCFLYHHMIFSIEFYGDDKSLQLQMNHYLKTLGIQPFVWRVDEAYIRSSLENKFSNKIDWVNVKCNGCQYVITYAIHQRRVHSDKTNNHLIALEDGVVAFYDVSNGNKMVEVNRFVHRGDVLVDDFVQVNDTKQSHIDVNGRVFAYVWKDVHISVKKVKIVRALQYFDLLLEARNIVTNDFLPNDKIVHEKILQFNEDVGKIDMKVHYKLYKDITTKRK